MQSVQFEDTRTGEIVTSFKITDIAFMKQIPQTTADARREIKNRRDGQSYFNNF